MDIIAIDRLNNLIWLGRYSERVYTTIKTFFKGYDMMLDDPYFYVTYCEHFQIPNIYKNQRDFIERYVLDENDPNSILSNLYRAYDNCIVLRNEIGTESMTYLEVALNNLKEIQDFDSFMLELQTVVDYILAFWACLSDLVEKYEVKTVIKLGRRIERLDLYLRLRKNLDEIRKAFVLLDDRMKRASVGYDIENYMTLKEMIYDDCLDYDKAIYLVESLID